VVQPQMLSLASRGTQSLEGGENFFVNPLRLAEDGAHASERERGRMRERQYSCNAPSSSQRFALGPSFSRKREKASGVYFVHAQCECAPTAARHD
jgi:hypothetical protein